MGVFDLLFMGVFFGTVIYGGWIVSLAVRRRWSPGRRHALRLGWAVAVYMVCRRRGRHGSGARFPGLFIITEGFRPAPVIRLSP